MRALGIVKRAAAEANMELGRLDPAIGETIVAAAQEVIDGKLDEHFPLVVWQTGSGTQSNMNANEVISNRAIEMLGGVDGLEEAGPSQRPRQHEPVVERHLSDGHAHRLRRARSCTTCCRRCKHLHAALDAKAKAFDHIIKIGRTHTQDATPLTLGQEFSGYAAQVDLGDQAHRADAARPVRTGAGRHRRRHRPQRADRLCREGGRARSPRSPACPSSPRRTSSRRWPRTMRWCSRHGAINAAAAALFKIANDIRLLGSGPRSGLGELSLPENEPGSSIMPGKVNPTQCEALTQVCVQVFGNNAAITFAGSQGHFELNVFNPVMAYNFLQSVRLLADAAVSFTDNCVVGIEAREDNIKAALDRSLMLVTALAPKIGYDNAAKIAKTAHKNGTTLREEALATGLVSEADYDRLVRPEDMTHPG